jgi:hypothetical protein
MVAMPVAMSFQDGVVYQATRKGVVAMPTDGSAAITLTSGGPATGIWVEADNVLYSNYDRLSSVPRTGGDATTLLDGGQHNDPNPRSDGSDYVGERQLLNDTAFYWTTVAYPYKTDGTHVWRMLRTGGAVEGFAQLPIETVDALAVAAGGVLAAGQSTTLDGPYHRAFVAPFGRGAAWELSLYPSPDKIIAAENGALLFSVYTGGRQERSETHEVWILPVDGSSAKRLSHNLPIEFIATWSIPDGQGGHVIGGMEIFDDGANHGSVFQVGGDGDATRLACDASGNWPAYTATALAPDALYVSVSYDQPGWLMVKIPR